MPYHIALNFAMGNICPVCRGDVHWFTVYSLGEGSYRCECRSTELLFKGFQLIRTTDQPIRVGGSTPP